MQVQEPTVVQVLMVVQVLTAMELELELVLESLILRRLMPMARQ